MTPEQITRLRNAVEWAYDEWKKEQRGEVSHWNQKVWVENLREALLDDMDNAHYAFNVGEADRLHDLIKSLPSNCGTACCIAGRLVLDAGYVPINDEYAIAEDGEERYIGAIAAELIGQDWTTRLFNSGNTIQDLYRIAEEISDGAITRPEELRV